MFFRLHRRRMALAAPRPLSLLWLFLAVAAAHAQPAKPAAPADPLDAKAAVPPLVHRSSLSTYRPVGEVQVRSWKEANDTVTRIGGWRAYLRESHPPEPAGPPASGATPAPAPASAAPTPASASAGAPSPAASAPASSTPPPPPQRGHGAHGRH